MGQTKNIKEQIGFLKAIQVLDKEIHLLNAEKENLPVRIKSIDESLEAKKTGIKEAETNLKTLQVKLKENEISLQQKEEQIKKLQLQLYQLKTNKEYSAMTHEIENTKADSSLIEEEIIKLMDGIDAARNMLSEEREIFKKEEEVSQKEKDVMNVRAREIDLRLMQLTGEREKITPNIDKQLLAGYERILQNREGLAIVQVEYGACGGCHLNLPPQVVNDAKLKEGIVVCGNCSRILYVDDDVEID
ncbi:MAG: C4-type zinc ribbon domain-containing protein [Candidatus Omnitrophota bacterium]